jgi:hypothetical protein
LSSPWRSPLSEKVARHASQQRREGRALWNSNQFDSHGHWFELAGVDDRGTAGSCPPLEDLGERHNARGHGDGSVAKLQDEFLRRGDPRNSQNSHDPEQEDLKECRPGTHRWR